jgi:hypothetical protein
MNFPHGEKFERLSAAVRALTGNGHFEEVIEWIRSERNARDAENRNVGSANRTSEAHALSRILELVEVANNHQRDSAGSVSHGESQTIVSPGYEGTG